MTEKVRNIRYSRMGNSTCRELRLTRGVLTGGTPGVGSRKVWSPPLRKMLTPTSRPSTICTRPARVAMPACHGMSPPLTAFTAISCKRTGDSEGEHRRSNQNVARDQPERHPNSRRRDGAATRELRGCAPAGARVLAKAAFDEHQAIPLDSSTTPHPCLSPRGPPTRMPEVAPTPSSPGPNPWVNNPPRNPVDKPTNVPISVRKTG